jgi:hypothetical protein
MIDIHLIKKAFRKLLTYTYFDKNDLQMRYNVASFTKELSNKKVEDRIFNTILNVAKGENVEVLNEWLDKMTLVFYPKKVYSTTNNNGKDPHVITNKDEGDAIVERLIVKADVPAELLILDVVWLLEYGYLVDNDLDNRCFGNRIDLMPNGIGVRKGNALFKKYHYQYQSWWKHGLKAANGHLKGGEDVTIINFDIENCYHSIDFDFPSFKNQFLMKHPKTDITTSPLMNVIEKIYGKYWELTHSSYAEPFCGNNRDKHPLSLSLLSSHVLANWYLSPIDRFVEKNKHKFQLIYYGRYVDDCMVVIKTKSDSTNINDSIVQEIPGLFKWGDDIISFSFAEDKKDDESNRLSTLRIQQDKLYIYRFDCQLPQESIEEYQNEQMERSSEFRFLTDDADEGTTTELESVTLVNSLDAQEEAGRRFNILEENKYKLSVYFAKLNSRLASYGVEGKYISEIEKIFKYFNHYLLIKHYLLWEKMFTAFVLAKRFDYVHEFEHKIQKQIDSLTIKEGLFIENDDYGIIIIKDSLRFHLEHSKLMAMSLVKEDRNISTLYLETFMVRMNYNKYPMQEFAKDFKTFGVRLPLTKLVYGSACWNYRWMPYYIKYCDIVCALSLGKPFDPKIYERAYKIYWNINVDIERSDEWKAFFYRSKKDDREYEITSSYWDDDPPETLLVNVVGMDIKDGEPSRMIGKPTSIDRVKLMKSILDGITRINKTDLFILPELSLPIFELKEYCLYSAKKEIAFVAGMEYFKYKGKIYNYIITCLPVILYGEKDAIPVIRLKNDYAPIEIKHLKEKRIPHNDKRWQILYHWKGHVFTTYYCFELTNVVERSHFFSKIDAMYCPVFNKDTYYFNNIGESCSRDMHCYFTLCNVSHYGDSRVTQPSKHETMNILKTKGGNTDENKAVILSAKLDIKSLREFQKLPLDKQQSDETFKCTPPNFPKDEVDKRKSRIILSTSNILDFDDDAFISNMIAMSKRFYFG